MNSTDDSKRNAQPKTPVECPECGDEGVIVDWANNQAKPCHCIKIKRINRVLKHSHIGDAFRSKTFENFSLEDKDERIVRAAKMATQYVREFDVIRSTEKNSFGIVGAVGSGKTHLVVAIANRLLQRGIGVRYFNFVTGFKEMFAKYDEGGAAVEEIRHELQTCEVLLLDDVAKGKPNRQTKLPDVSDAVFIEMYGIIEHRYFANLPILWTSELHEELLDVLGQATASRMFERSAGRIADVSYRKGEKYGMNYRLTKGGE